ncbi:MAG: hypothetical protein R3A47_08305 [Polyangiales bacterium]
MNADVAAVTRKASGFAHLFALDGIDLGTLCDMGCSEKGTGS